MNPKGEKKEQIKPAGGEEEESKRGRTDLFHPSFPWKERKKLSYIYKHRRVTKLAAPVLLESLHPLPPSETKPSPPLSPPPPPPPDPGTPISISLPEAEKLIVVCYTSLRVVRKTFEDCRTIQSILKGFRVSIDERDLSMDAGFLEELQSILVTEDLTLPKVFIGSRYVGGAEKIRQLHETGKLKKFVQGFPIIVSNYIR